MHFQLFYIFDCDVLVTKILTIAFLANWLSQVMYFRPFYIFECDVSSHYNPIIVFKLVVTGDIPSFQSVASRGRNLILFMFYGWCLHLIHWAKLSSVQTQLSLDS